MRLEIAICDDVPQEAELLAGYVQDYFEGNCTIDIYYTGSDLINSNKEYKIMFLDIELGKISGIDVANSVKKKKKQTYIIFVTNFEGYCRQALSVHAFEYVLKPIQRRELFGVLDELDDYLKKDIGNKLIRLKTEKGIVQVPIEQIEYYEYVGRKVKMVLQMDSLFVNYTLENILKLLTKYDFVMPHRAYIVNLSKIKMINKYDILMENGDIIPLAQKKAASFKRNFEIYLYKQV